MYYKLIREEAAGKAVHGRLYRTSHYYNNRTGLWTERLHPVCVTLENADRLIPALIYEVGVTLSPKFGRLLPVIRQVPGRTGIRIHRGTRPEHSQGCILVSADDERRLTERFHSEQQRHKECRLEITTIIKPKS